LGENLCTLMLLSHLGVCVTNKTGFGIEFIGPLYNLLQHCTSHSPLLTTLHQSTSLTELSVIVGISLYSLGSDLTENTSITYQWMSSIFVYSLEHVHLATGCLPRICLSGKMFIDPLPSNGSISHIIIRQPS
jgi:hypothetical protein